jgi:hypothetical protein
MEDRPSGCGIRPRRDGGDPDRPECGGGGSESLLIATESAGRMNSQERPTIANHT